MHYKFESLVVFLVLFFCNGCIFANSSIYPTVESPQQLMIFVSTSMPKWSLQLWAQQADKIKAPLYLRGFVGNSLRKTIGKTQELFGDQEIGGFQIHPEKFQEYGIQKVPAVVLVKSTQDFDVVYGDVGLKAALKQLYRYGESKQAARLLEQYDKK